MNDSTLVRATSSKVRENPFLTDSDRRDGQDVVGRTFIPGMAPAGGQAVVGGGRWDLRQGPLPPAGEDAGDDGRQPAAEGCDLAFLWTFTWTKAWARCRGWTSWWIAPNSGGTHDPKPPREPRRQASDALTGAAGGGHSCGSTPRGERRRNPGRLRTAAQLGRTILKEPTKSGDAHIWLTWVPESA